MNDSISSLPEVSLPTMVIAGRPNVGKSTLFNRLLGRRRAITHETPGVTRDPIRIRTRIDGNPCFLVDTGGFTLSREDLDTSVREKGLAYLDAADIILLLVDIRNVIPEDEAFIERLRPYANKVFLIANKADTPETELMLGDLYRYGFSTVIPLSAVHGRNIDELEKFLARRLEETAGEVSPSPRVEDEEGGPINVAILGKPNTGKSTLVNALSGRELSIVSEIPGTTRDVIEGGFGYKGKHYRILDTAGIRRKNRIREDIEYYSVNRAIKTIEEADVVFLLIDATESVTEQDKKISSLIVRKGKGVILVVNKWDLMEDLPNQRNAYEDRIRFMFPILDFAPVVFISALEGRGIPALLNRAYKIESQLETEVRTPLLNKYLEEWVTRVPPPRSGRGQYKVRYMVQKSSKPVRFILFVNRVKGFPKNYVMYIKNNVRKTFHLADIPLEIDVREKTKPTP
ncbi:MAG: ribosome biogenesis GTPase Der [Spirochaetia bacterium]